MPGMGGILRWANSVPPPALSPEDRLRHRQQELEEAVSGLVGGATLMEVLKRLCSHAGSAAGASGILLAVSLPGGGRHVETYGLGRGLEPALDADGTGLDLSGTAMEGWAVLTSRIASAGQHYGVLAAVAGPGRELLAEDAGTLAAYAHLAAAALDRAGLAAEARESAETSKLLLDVARSLAEGSTVKAVAAAVADAVPTLSGASRSAVALWDAEIGALRIAGMSGWFGTAAEKLADYGTTPEESPELAQLLGSGAPLLVNHASSEWAQNMLADFELCALAAVPIMAGERVAGLVIAHWPDEPAPESLEGVLTRRLTGLASLAEVALDKIKLLEEARRQALHDPLTGLPNRALLEDRLEASLAQAEREGHRVGVVFCDINRFKRINDSLGHGAGDSVLRQVAGRLQEAVRSTDTVARYSGDEFVILLPGLESEPEAQHLAARVRAGLSEPLEINGRSLVVDVAIGTSVSGAVLHEPSDTQSEAARLLIEEADFQMYRSKALRRGQRLPSRYKDALRLEIDLRAAIRRGELRVHYQPQIDVRTNRIIAAEALVRWQHPELGLLPPAEFIGVAEESDLITEVGAFVLAEACRTGAAWRAAGCGIEVSVNISAVQLESPDFPAFVSATLECSGFPAKDLTLEVTESQAVSETLVNDSTLAGLRALGVGISVDDFGTGYSSLAQLHRLPVTEVKIDRTFTARLAEKGSAAFVGGIAGLGHGLGLRVVAEGVETRSQLDALRAMGCERAQGYLFSKPVEASALQELLAGQKRMD